MNTVISTIIGSFENMLHGEPWFGRSAEELLAEVNPANAYTKPANTDHSMCDLLWHLVTWAAFTRNRIEGNRSKDVATNEDLDWRKTGPKENNWEKGIAEFKSVHETIISLLRKKDDGWLHEKVDYREYDFKYLLEGLIQHDIYHLGQIVYCNKLLG